MVGTLVDYNRGGTPLIEIVTEPVFSNAEEVCEFLRKIREALVFADIANCKMEEGGMRCDVNLSLKPKGSTKFGTRTEMKNLNSFKSVSSAIAFEIQRQKEILSNGGVVFQETRKWNDDLGENFALRSKEETQDYRYFPDPDILPIKISMADVEELKKQIPVLPNERRKKYMQEFMLSQSEAELLTTDRYISDYFETCVKIYNNTKKISNWILTEFLRRIKETGSSKFSISEQDLADIVKMVEDKKITKANGIILIDEIEKTHNSAEILAKELNLISTITEAQIIEFLNRFKQENPKAVEDFKTDPKVQSFIIGYVMKNTQGKADGQTVKELIQKMF